MSIDDVIRRYVEHPGDHPHERKAGPKPRKERRPSWVMHPVQSSICDERDPRDRAACAIDDEAIPGDFRFSKRAGR